VVEGREPGAAILDEAQKHYQLMLLGATDSAPRSGSLFHPMVDEMVRLAPCATVVIKGNGGGATWPPKRVLVPTNGSVASRHAADIASLLATEANEEVIVLNVAEERGGLSGYGALGGSITREMDARRHFVDELVERLRAYDVSARGVVTMGSDVDSVILETARRERIDLLVVGTDVRPGSDRLFLGPRVERILYGAPCPVIVINA
jgi:nucleotide-binding universal stress UspA family protein